MKIVDLTGQKFGRLTVLDTYRKNKKTYCKCQCECGNVKTVLSMDLKNGSTKSCGCLNKEKIENLNKTHGLAHTRLYNVWCNIKSRCYNTKNKSYNRYGGRGVIMCHDWKNDFMSFYEWSMNNGYNINAKYGECSIDRININGIYEPSNCRWVDYKIQANNRSNSFYVVYKNEKYTLAEICDKLNLNYKKIHLRLTRYKWTVEKALTTP